MKSSARFLILTTVSLTLGIAQGQDAGWPKVVNDGRTQITIYQPQPDSLEGGTLQGRVAVSLKRPQDTAPLFGALWVSAALDIDRDRARFVSFKVDRTRFPDLPEAEVHSLVQLLEADVPLWDLSISMTNLKASLQPDEAGPAAGYRNEPPKIIVVDSPAILLLLDGEPRLQDAGSGGLQQVVNTALPVIFDPKSKQYWLYGSSVWFTTNDLLRGKWRSTSTAPSNVATLVKSADTLNSAQTDAGKAASPAQLRNAKIIVATEPTELIVTEGAPKYSPLVGGEILYVTNTDSDIFMETATQRHYTVISGRWFSGPSIQGPWTFVAPENLPKAFADIPENSRKANDLAFVPGTDRAQDAVLDNAIPQTAEVSRKDTKIDVKYDGAPQFSPIPNTSLQYAENTPSQVIQANRMYYACEEGVWYVAPSPTGPWSVSDVRPPGVDDIPPSSPVYNTKYVYVYGSTPAVVYVGYLPGYRWSFPYHGVVFYGTGWRYRGWFGRYYYPRPATWGFCVRYNPWAGWSFGMSWTSGWLGFTSGWGSGWAGWMPVYGPGFHPGFWSGYYAGGWFGPGGYRPPRPPYWRPPVRPGHVTIQPYPGPGWHPANNLYDRPGRPGPRPRPIAGAIPGRPTLQPSRPSGIGTPGGRGPGRPAPGTPPSKPQPQPDLPGAGRIGGRGPGGPQTQPDLPGAGRSGGRGPSGPGAGTPPSKPQPQPDLPGAGRIGGRGPGGPQTQPDHPGTGRSGGRGPSGPGAGTPPGKPQTQPDLPAAGRIGGRGPSGPGAGTPPSKPQPQPDLPGTERSGGRGPSGPSAGGSPRGPQPQPGGPAAGSPGGRGPGGPGAGPSPRRPQAQPGGPGGGRSPGRPGQTTLPQANRTDPAIKPNPEN